MGKVIVTGLGVISSLGNHQEETLHALRKGTCGISTLDLFETRYASSLRFGEIKISSESLKEKLKVSSSSVTRTSLLALHAMQDALRDGGWDKQTIASRDTALVIGNTVGGMCLTDELYHDANSKDKGSPYIDSYDCGSVTLFLREHFQIKGPCNTINTACSSSANAIIYGARLIQHGLAKRAVVGGCDSLARFTINGFNALGILSSELCTPFDNARKGLNLGEGAGIILLEREEDIKNRNGYASLEGDANANDSFHPSSLSDSGIGPVNVMTKALQKAGINPERIGFISTHGTGTENNDLVESRAMKTVFTHVPRFISSKSKIGHTLGASAALEAVFALLGLKNQEVYPSLRCKNVIPETNLMPQAIMEKLEYDFLMSNSFGFGGHCSSLIFKKY